MTTPFARTPDSTRTLEERPPRWSVQLLGRFQLTDGHQTHTRLATRAMSALLARLALWPQRDHAREELVELLWPGVDSEAGRRRLRQALSMLKDVLEPPEHGVAPVLQADRQRVRVVDGALHCDVLDFERLGRSGRAAEALAAYRGELLPGFYDEWIVVERQRLSNLHERLGPTVAEALRSPTPAWPDVTRAGATHRQRDVSPRTDRSALPNFLTRYLGDSEQVRRLAQRVQQHRWVTLTGPGGSGKTRLAVELARRMHATEPAPEEAADNPDAGDPVGVAASFDRVVYVPLVGALERQQAVDSLARALRIDASNPTAEAVVARLAGWKTLLVLDNFEQLFGVAEDLLLQLVDELPTVHLLVTSRRSLGVDGEQLFAIAPLALPAAGASMQAVAASPAVALFVDRAVAVRADFHLGQRNHAVVGALVAALEGMPLAIELAASRLRSVSPAEMLERLRPDLPRAPGETPRLDLLARPSGRAAADPRHASMSRAIEWSWRLLDEPQRQLVGALSVFGGGCSLAVLAHVIGGGGDVAWTLDPLISHSLVQVQPAEPGGDADRRRFRLYPPVREYAAAQVDAARMAHWRARHRSWVLAWADALPVTPSLAEVRGHLDDIAAALQSAAGDGAGDDAVRLLLALHHSLEDVELPHAALAHASAAVDACRDDLLRSRGHTAVGPLLFAAGQKEASLRHVEAALQHLPAEPVLRARALYAAARLRWRSDMRHPERVLPVVEEAQALAEAAGDSYLVAGLLSLRAFITHVLDGTPDAALALHRRALKHWEAFGNRHAVNIGRFNVAVFEFHAGRPTQALAQFEAIAAEAEVLQDWRRVAVVNDARGNVLSELRRWPEAVDAYWQSLALAWQTMSVYNLAYALWNLPRALAHVRQPVVALNLAAFAEIFWVEHVGALTASDHHDLRRVRRLAACQLSPRACAEAWARGRLLTLAEAMALVPAAPDHRN